MATETVVEKKAPAWVEEMASISTRHNGLLRAEDVEEFARNPKTALHPKFLWDDTEAARQYRLWQARELIAVVVVFLPETGKEYRAYVSMGSDREKEGGGYRPIVSVLADKTRREQLVDEALADFDRWKAKYEMLSELADVFAARARVHRK